MPSQNQTGLELPESVLAARITEIPSLNALLQGLAGTPANAMHLAIFAPGATEPLFMVSVSRGSDAVGIYEAAKSVGEAIIESRPAARN